MRTFSLTRVPLLSWLPTAGQNSAAAVHPNRVQIGGHDKCASGISSSTVTYLCFSRNFTRLGVPLKKWPRLACSTHASEPRCTLLCTSLSSHTVPVDCFADSVNCWHTTSCPRLTTASTSDCNHRSLTSTTLADYHLGLHLFANKLTGNFGYTAATNSTRGNSSHWARIGAIKARDTGNNKWTSVGQPTRPQHEEQVLRPLLDEAVTASTVAAPLESPLAASPVLVRRCNVPNKLMTSSSVPLLGTMQRRMIHQQQHTISASANNPFSRRVATSRSAVSGEVICKRQRTTALMGIASLWTSSSRLDNKHDSSKRCWRCDKEITAMPSPKDEATKVPVCEKCGSIQPISCDVNFFGLFNLDPSFDIDLAQLRQHYLRLQQNMHPDMNVNRSNAETGYSLDNSSLINSAYKTLRDPYQRALYMLKVRYNMSIDEGNIQTEPELLLEIMELNEDIELADDKKSLMDVSARLEEGIQAIVAQLKKAFSEDNASEARALVVRYAYYNSSLLKLKGQLADMS